MRNLKTKYVRIGVQNIPIGGLLDKRYLLKKNESS